MAIDFGKKVAGVPVVYIAGGAVAIFAVVALRMKSTPNTSPTDTASTEDAVLDENGHADGSNPYAGYSTNGTVIVQPAVPTPVDPADNRPGTNDEWLREGAEWLVAEKKVSGVAAYTALEKFLEGRSRSVQEAQWVEWVIAEKGFPPDPFVNANPAAPATPTTPTTNPNVVTGGRVTSRGYNSLVLVWNPVPNAHSYAVFQSGRGKVGTTVLPGYTVTGLKRGTTYRFQVAAIMRPDMKQAQASAYFSGTTA